MGNTRSHLNESNLGPKYISDFFFRNYEHSRNYKEKSKAIKKHLVHK